MTVLNPSGRADSLRVDASGRLLVSGSGGGGGGTADLSYNASTRVVANTNGTGFTLPMATTSVAGLMAAADKTKLDSVTTVTITRGADRVYINNGLGSTSIDGATQTVHGSLSPGDKTKIDGGFPSNLAVGTGTNTTMAITNSNGTGVTLPAAVSGTTAGLMTGTQALSANRWVIAGRGTWASRPAASANAGSLYVATDIGTVQGGSSGTVFVSDGTWWRPLNGHAMLYSANGSTNTPVATNTANGSTSLVFTLPATIAIPSGLLNIPGATLRVTALLYRGTVGSGPVSANGICWLDNTNGLVTGNQLFASAMGTASGRYMLIDTPVSPNPADNRYACPPPTPGVLAVSQDRSGFDPTATAYVYFGTSGSFESGAVLSLLSYSITLNA